MTLTSKAISALVLLVALVAAVCADSVVFSVSNGLYVHDFNTTSTHKLNGERFQGTIMRYDVATERFFFVNEIGLCWTAGDVKGQPWTLASYVVWRFDSNEQFRFNNVRNFELDHRQQWAYLLTTKRIVRVSFDGSVAEDVPGDHSLTAGFDIDTITDPNATRLFYWNGTNEDLYYISESNWTNVTRINVPNPGVTTTNYFPWSFDFANNEFYYATYFGSSYRWYRYKWDNATVATRLDTNITVKPYQVVFNPADSFLYGFGYRSNPFNYFYFKMNTTDNTWDLNTSNPLVVGQDLVAGASSFSIEEDGYLYFINYNSPVRMTLNMSFNETLIADLPVELQFSDIGGIAIQNNVDGATRLIFGDDRSSYGGVLAVELGTDNKTVIRLREDIYDYNDIELNGTNIWFGHSVSFIGSDRSVAYGALNVTNNFEETYYVQAQPSRGEYNNVEIEGSNYYTTLGSGWLVKSARSATFSQRARDIFSPRAQFLLQPDFSQVSCFDIDPITNKIWWMEVASRRFSRANLDMTDVEHLPFSPAYRVSGFSADVPRFTLDYVNQKIYYWNYEGSYSRAELRRVDYDGGNDIRLYLNDTYPVMDVFFCKAANATFLADQSNSNNGYSRVSRLGDSINTETPLVFINKTIPSFTDASMQLACDDDTTNPRVFLFRALESSIYAFPAKHDAATNGRLNLTTLDLIGYFPYTVNDMRWYNSGLANGTFFVNANYQYYENGNNLVRASSIFMLDTNTSLITQDPRKYAKYSGQSWLLPVNDTHFIYSEFNTKRFGVDLLNASLSDPKEFDPTIYALDGLDLVQIDGVWKLYAADPASGRVWRLNLDGTQREWVTTIPGVNNSADNRDRNRLLVEVRMSGAVPQLILAHSLWSDRVAKLYRYSDARAVNNAGVLTELETYPGLFITDMEITTVPPPALPPNALEVSSGFVPQIDRCVPNRHDCNRFFFDGCEADFNNIQTCGSCSKNCIEELGSSNVTCNNGQCERGSCPALTGNCDANPGCEANLTLATTCGSCSNNCNNINVSNVMTRTCTSDGHCAILSCQVGYADCNGEFADGCETDIRLPENCGTCKNDCNALPGANTSTCTAGVCAVSSCSAGYDQCDANTANGCEPLFASTSCGDCGFSCLSYPNVTAASCVSPGVCGSLTCTTGNYDCDSNVTNGCEQDYPCGTVAPPPVLIVPSNPPVPVTVNPPVPDATVPNTVGPSGEVSAPAQAPVTVTSMSTSVTSAPVTVGSSQPPSSTGGVPTPATTSITPQGGNTPTPSRTVGSGASAVSVLYAVVAFAIAALF